MNRFKKNKGITLVALIITVIILLILAVVSIQAVTGDGIITKAKSARSEYEIAQEKEEIQLGLLEWQLVQKNGEPTLKDYLKDKYGEGNIQPNADGSVTVTLPNGNRYVVSSNGDVTYLDGTVEEPEPLVPSITLDKTSIIKEITSGSTTTENITATLNNASGELSWTSSNTSVAEISGTGNTRTITLKKAGTANITVSYNKYSAVCNITVTEKQVSAFEKITAGNYGDKIEYNDPAGVNDWKVFYKDADHLYIITSDYLENTKLPSGLKMSTYSGYPYSAYWSSTSNFTSTGASTITSAVANKYGLSWWANNSTSTNYNARATADLLNTTAWTAKFGNSSKGIEAIGSPTLEMWIASWNAKGYTKLYTTSNATGYYVGTTENPTTTYKSLSSDTAGYADKLYFPHTSVVSNCSAYWLASPSAGGSSSVMYVDYYGYVDNNGYSYSSYAVRPLVTLPSEVITTTADGTLKVAK